MYLTLSTITHAVYVREANAVEVYATYEDFECDTRFRITITPSTVRVEALHGVEGGSLLVDDDFNVAKVSIQSDLISATRRLYNMVGKA